MKPSSTTKKYRPYLEQFQVLLPDRRWPERQITAAPRWCSVDLRDGNQALINPMDYERKRRMFELLLAVGFQEIEIGFPSASQTEFDFTRAIIDQKIIPDDVWPQVLIQCRKHLIDRTFEAISGARQCIVHIYNSTSELQRRVVFGMDKSQIKDIALQAVQDVKSACKKSSTQVLLEYSPESFTGTELPYALEVCEAVLDEWGATPEKPVIINLPATVEMHTPNVHADQIEWFLRNLKSRERVILSVHPHNDRGTGVAATELALLAGADRVEGTLFGNGERTGNVDIVTLALNMLTQGVDPKLDFSTLPEVRRIAEECTELPVPPRHPYAGDLVFTAFSGSHQDAINKGFQARAKSNSPFWEVPYLPIDPADLSREYEALIRINSQSGKGGVAFILAHEFGCEIPKDMHPDFAKVIQHVSDLTGKEVLSQHIWAAFSETYLETRQPYEFENFLAASLVEDPDTVKARLRLKVRGEEKELRGHGNGPIDACRNALIESGLVPQFGISAYHQHARTAGSAAESVAYVQIEMPDGKKTWGAGIDANTGKAAIRAIVSALNRA